MQVNTHSQTQPDLSQVFARRLLSDQLALLLLLVGAMLAAVQLRLQLPLGQALGADYVAQPPLLYVILVLTSFAASYLGALWRQFMKLRRSRRTHFLSLMVAIALSFFGVALLLPGVSLLQLLYFVLLAALFGLLTIWWTPTLPDADEESTLLRHLMQLWERRALLVLWTQSNIRARYSQAFLGILWIVILPIAQSLILAIVFSQILQRAITTSVPFIVFFLTALTFWNFFQQGISKSMNSIIGSMTVITRVYFPREILVLVQLFEAMVDLAFMFVVMLVINAAMGVYPSPHILYLPLIFAVQLILMLGLMLFLSYVSVLVRDIPQLVSIILQFLFYLTPILFPLDMVPQHLRFIVILNPLAGLIQAYRDVIIYHQSPDLIALYYPVVMGGVLLYMGYLFFKANELTLADYV